MQKVNQNSQEKQLKEQLDDDSQLLQSIIQAHDLVYSLDTVPLIAENLGSNQLSLDFNERFPSIIRSIVEFGKRIPGFAMFCQVCQLFL